MSVVIQKLSKNSHRNSSSVCAALTRIISCTKNNKRALCCVQQPRTVELITALLNKENGFGDCPICQQSLVPHTLNTSKGKNKQSTSDGEDVCDSDCESDCEDCQGRPNDVVALSCHHLYHKACLKKMHTDHMGKVLANVEDAWKTNSVIRKCRFKCAQCRQIVCLEHYYSVDKALLVATHNVSLQRDKKRKATVDVNASLTVDTAVGASLPRNKRRLVRANHNFPAGQNSSHPLASSSTLPLPSTPDQPATVGGQVIGVGAARRIAAGNARQTRRLRRQQSFWNSRTTNLSSDSDTGTHEDLIDMTLDDVLVV